MASKRTALRLCPSQRWLASSHNNGSSSTTTKTALVPILARTSRRRMSTAPSTLSSHHAPGITTTRTTTVPFNTVADVAYRARPRCHHTSRCTCIGGNRTIHSSCSLRKSGGKGSRGSPSSSSSSSSKTESTQSADPMDMDQLKSDLTNAVARLKEELGKLRPGGRFNPEVLDNLRVKLDKESRETVRLGDLAQVVPKGRIVSVIVGEKDHVKAVSSAILGSESLSLNPQPDPHNPSQLNIQLPPPTTDARMQAAQSAKKAGEGATAAIKKAQHTQQKKFRAMEKDKTVRPDDRRKGETLMEKTVKQHSEEAKKMVEAAKKALESS